MPHTETETRYNVAFANESGEISERKNIVESAFEKLVKEKGADAVEKTRVKAFVITEATTVEEGTSLWPQRALEFMNYGARLAQHNLKQDLMEDPDWADADTEGAFDLLPHIQEPRERKKATGRDKIINLCVKLAKESGKELDRAAIEAMLAQFIPNEVAA